jgi:ParB family transcriptional regulator, chromosome partitioning protein
MLSIASLGLLEPLVVDIHGRLLAGGHRKAAIQLLKEQMPSEYATHFPDDLVPVRILDFDSEERADLALQVEIAENEKRRDYTPTEVKVLAERLKSAGYVDTNGRPALGEKALRPALKVIIGKSIRTIQRYLNEGLEKSTTDVMLFSRAKTLNSLKARLLNWQKKYSGSDDTAVCSIESSVLELLKQLEDHL